MIDKITPSAMLGIMFLLHFVADFTLQGWLADGKQWRWWRRQIPEKDEAAWEKYKDDYKVALWCHSFYWALIVCLPLVACGGIAYMANALAHMAVHYVVDDMKANRLRLNLKWDQTIHAIQVLCIWASLMIL